jgi:alkanesulfonate monooxygenase SsuD/methylene tetrahydromethanopterin reductase-like flavin-dependent oxidoreductase (luciferase family)
VTHPLSEIQAGYEQRAAQALQAPVSPQEPPVRRKGTRTYTGPALARRQAWGLFFGGIISEAARDLREKAV